MKLKREDTVLLLKKSPNGMEQKNLYIKSLSNTTCKDIESAVKCPGDYLKNEWIAINCFDFFNDIMLTYSSITSLCTNARCPVMNAGATIEYLWLEDESPVKMGAPDYINKLFTWIQECFDDTKIFPTEFGSSTPKPFKQTVCKIFKRLFRVYAHMFHSHTEHLEQLNIFSVALRGFKHFYIFCREYKMLEKEDLEPLRKLVLTVDKEFNLSTL
ncbi:Mob1/phocein family protein [Entamoeba marina]